MILTLLPIMATSFWDSAEDNAALINIISGKYAMASCSKRRGKIITNLAPTYWRRFSGTHKTVNIFSKQPISKTCRSGYYQKQIELIELKQNSKCHYLSISGQLFELRYVVYSVQYGCGISIQNLY